MTDESIIELFFKRSEQGIRELDSKYGKLFYTISYNILNSRPDAEECVNDTYLGAWNAIPPANPRPLLSYVCRIARNISLKRFYRMGSAKRSSVYEAAMQELETCLASKDTVEETVGIMELAGIIEDFLDTLSAENRVLFLRRYWFSDSYADLARRVGLTEKNVSVRLTRIRGKMKQYLKEREVMV